MKKITLLIISTLTLSLTYGQKKRENLPEFTASNGITYKIGDEIKLGRGSDTNGKFVYVNVGGWITSSNPEDNRLSPTDAGSLMTLKKIKKYNSKRFKGVYFIVGGGKITNYTLDIENAIKTCEVENCIKEVQKVEVVRNTSDRYDQLNKIKKLLDDGVLTQQEYKTEKKKILERKE